MVSGGGSVMVTTSVSVQGAQLMNEISSNPKSFPARIVFWFSMQMVAEVFDPEFQTQKNCCQVQQTEGAVKTLHRGVPLIEN
jgi:hypothetical protein